MPCTGASSHKTSKFATFSFYWPITLLGEQHYFCPLSRYPGRIIEVIYDDLVKSPVAGFQQIYDFFNLTAPQEVKSLKHLTRTGAAQGWIKNMDDEAIKNVDVACQELYAVLRNRWPHWMLTLCMVTWLLQIKDRFVISGVVNQYWTF